MAVYAMLLAVANGGFSPVKLFMSLTQPLKDLLEACAGNRVFLRSTPV